MKINCPKCDTPVLSQDIHEADSMAVCRNCFHLVKLDSYRQDNTPVDNSHKNILVPPDGVAARSEYNNLIIQVESRKLTKGWWEFWFGFAFMVIPTIMIFALLFAPDASNPAPWFVFIFLGIFEAIGLYMLWEGFCKIVNVATIKVGSQDMTVNYSPINFGKYKTRKYPVSEIEQFFVRRYSNKKQNDRPVYEYAVDFKTNNENKIAWLLKGLSDVEAAWFIESEIESYLGIQDQYVEGEFDPHYQAPRLSLGTILREFKTMFSSRE